MQEHIVKRRDLEDALRQWTQYREMKDILVIPFQFKNDGKIIVVTQYLVYMK